MRALDNIKNRVVFAFVVMMVAALAACSDGGTGSDSNSDSGDDSVTIQGNVPIAYVRRPVSTLGNPTDSIITGAGGDLYVRDRSSPSGSETNVTGSYTDGKGDVSDPEVSYDGKEVLFAMRRNGDAHWSIWEYNTETKNLRQISCQSSFAGDDVDPAYLPDGRIVFVSNRQIGSKTKMTADGGPVYTYHDEYEREETTALHVMNADGSSCQQISFNQSHDRNPTVLSTGEILFSRWDHVGERNQFTVFKVNPDGTNLFVVYGAHSPGNSYLHPREMPDGRLMSTTMPLSGTNEGGSLEIMDPNNYSDATDPGTSNPPPNQLGETRGQFQVTKLLFPSSPDAEHEAARGMGPASLGRYSSPYPLWDNTSRALVVYSPCRVLLDGQAVSCKDSRVKDQLDQYEEADPAYGIYMLSLTDKTLRPVVVQQTSYYYSDPVALQARPVPQVKSNFVPDTTIGSGLGLFDVNTVYDTDSRQRMGDAVLADGESIPRASGRPDIANLKLPGTTTFDNRVARFFRITKAVPTPGGLSREAIGETESEMQQIIGYGVIEPDGSVRAKVPSDTPITITALDKEGRAFTPHTHWIQAREGERRFCKGCHSSRLGTTNASGGNFLNDPATVGIHPGGTEATTMAQTRAADSTYAKLTRDPTFADYWTSLYNTRDSKTVTAQDPIAISYPNASSRTIKGPAHCADPATWSAKDCSIVINFPDHVQPILTAKCATSGCHNSSTSAAGLDLSATTSGSTGRYISYEALMVGTPILDSNGRPIINVNEDGELEIERESAAVTAGSARSSRLIERMYEQKLKAENPSTGTQRAFCRTGNSNCTNGATYVSHVGQAWSLTSSERRVLNEWTDLGGQYYNDPFDNSGNVRSSMAQLSETAFGCRVQPILQAQCASCHQPFSGNGSSENPVNGSFAGNRFILTGNVGADFSVAASMVTNLTDPDSSLLLYRPSRTETQTPSHPGSVARLPLGSDNYTALRNWITGGPSLGCP
ncbi:MAG: hypothetical protein HY308_14925 [Gammaproteobacteria bacterium]|nr:hypothetical protein [Gammaproteobacteria bacterium]